MRAIKHHKITILFCLFFLQSVSIQAHAGEPIEKRLDRMDLKLERLEKIEAQVLENRERLIRLEAGVEEGFKGVDARFAAMDQKFDQRFAAMDQRLVDMNQKFDQRFADMNQRITDMGQRITDMNNLLYVVLGGIIALIGFVIWDRRTAVAPVARKNRELEEREDLLEKVLKEYAKKEPQLAEVLRNVGLI
jgi:hypothetical protein